MIQIHGFQTLTLLDYPGILAATVFLGHCNFRCPFCQNGNLVLHPEKEPILSEKEILAFLEKRRKMLEGVCITGGEPTLDPELAPFIRRIKEIGYKVKLDTNGYRPEVIKKLAADGLIDFIAMDIKNSPEKYAETAGIKDLDLLKIEESVEFLKQGTVDYEFRTTVARELHSREDIEKIGHWLSGARRYYLQNYRESGSVIQPGFSGYSGEQLQRFSDMLKKEINEVGIRGDV